MRVAYVTHYNARDINKWSGSGYYIAQSLEQQAVDLDYIGPLKDKMICRIIRKSKRHYHEIFNKRYLKDPEPFILKDFASQITQKLSRRKVDFVFSPTTNPIAYLDCDQPIAFWADATFASVLNFYPHYSNLCQETVDAGHQMERLALQKSKLAIYSSEWAAESAIKHYQTDPTKVKVVPFGANINETRTQQDIQDIIEARPDNECKLLFLGVDWLRKGGDIALQVAQKLNQSGLRTKLTIVGCNPDIKESLHGFVEVVGFIDKASNCGLRKINQLLAESHFLILPSRAECYGIVFCEANSLGVPCISRKVGGIPTIIKDDLNGKLFDETADPTEYCKYILDLFTNYTEYKNLALSAFNEYESRLNWKVSGQKIRDLLMMIA